ncbi:MAG TPA: endolytic transglycosylase MltG [Xanthobacteraceae bacterium]|nr:endolytic transglycosylase MltG [Xanthobacteraceae bacterium]
MADQIRSDRPASDPAPHEPQYRPDPAAPERVPESAPPIARSEQSRITPRSARARLEPERVPQPARASRRARHPFVVAGNAVFTTIIIVAVAAGIAIALGKQRFETAGPLKEDRVVNIPRGGVQDIADTLLREGVIDQKWVFIGGVLVLKAREDLKFGEYEFKAHASLREVVDTLVEGKVVQHQVTVPEGLTSEQIVARLIQNSVLSGNVREIPREGSLLPETYRFTRGFPRELLVQRMQQAQRRVLQEVWERRSPDLPVKTPEQLLVLASIVEKETGRADERARVAAVFVNRLRQGMRLQSDPTIIYGLVGGKGTLGRPIMRSEIEQPTPYNTYVIQGLPPGPIANPGRASIEATANPSRTRELYFVADGSGGHAFSETLEQHQRNVARLRQIEQQQREAARAQDSQAPAYAPEGRVLEPQPQATPSAAPVPQPTARPGTRPARAQGASVPRPSRQQ